MSACQPGLRPNVPGCQCGVCVNVLAYQLAKGVPTSHFYMPTCQQMWQLAKQHAKFSNWLPTCQKLCQFFKNSSYQMLREIKNSNSISKLYILYVYVYVTHVKIVLYFVSMLHVILKESVPKFSFFLFSFFVLYLEMKL